MPLAPLAALALIVAAALLSRRYRSVRTTSDGPDGALRRHAYLVGRLMLALLFVSAALRNLFDLSSVVEQMSNVVPGAGLVVPALLLFEGVVGLLIAADLRGSRPAATALGAYVLALCFVLYPFWTIGGPERVVMANYFWKTFGVAGGVFLYAGSRPPVTVVAPQPAKI